MPPNFDGHPLRPYQRRRLIDSKLEAPRPPARASSESRSDSAETAQPGRCRFGAGGTPRSLRAFLFEMSMQTVNGVDLKAPFAVPTDTSMTRRDPGGPKPLTNC